MTIDKPALKALAEAAMQVEDEHEWYSPDGGYGLDPTDLKLIAAAKPAAILSLLAEIERLDSESLCPACKSSGEGWVMSDSGPDAHHIQVDCPECFGPGTMVGAYKAMKIQRDSQIERTTKAGGELFFMRIEFEKLKAENESLRKDAERNNRMLVASCITIGEICEALGIDNHSEPDMIVEAVRELKADKGRLREDLILAKQAPLYSVRRDAWRYRWLRDHHIGDDPESINLECAGTPGLSAAIDAAAGNDESI